MTKSGEFLTPPMMVDCTRKNSFCCCYINEFLIFYRSATDVLNRKQFQVRKEAVREALFPSRKPHILFSSDCRSHDQFLQELATRERPNRVGMMTVGNKKMF